MSLINVNNLTISFTEEDVLKGITFAVEPRDKIGLIGANGAGKSTIFKILTKQYLPTDGNFTFAKECSLGYMEQHACADSDKTVYTELLTVFEPLFQIEQEINDIQKSLNEHNSDFADKLESQNYLHREYERRGGLTYQSRAKSALIGIGFTENDFDLDVSLLSGGQKSKLSLCKLLLCGADVLLLDEPTNHLDIKSIDWLENWLTEYKGTYIVISHDRYFLDKVTNKTIEIERGKLYSANKNYSGYMLLKDERKKAQQKVFDGAMKEVHRIEGMIEQQKRFNQAHNYVTIASKQKSIDRILDDLEEPEKELSGIRFRFEAASESGNDVLLLTDIEKSFDNKFLFSNVQLDLKKGDRCFIIGDNGCGKSTLLKVILNKMRRDKGRIALGVGLKIGYFDQSLAELSSGKTVIDEIWDTYRNMTETEVRSALAQFLFKADDVYKNMNDLSGGEKARVALLKLMLSGANFLILDEPTNHLDIKSRQALEDALIDYNGTLLIVSHDRYLINKLATRIEYLDTDGLTSYIGNYDSYIQNVTTLNEPELKKSNTKVKDNDYKRQKEHNSYIRKLKGKISRLEADIENLENKAEQLQEEMNNSTSDYETILELTNQLNDLTQIQEEKMLEWESLCEELSNLETED